MVHVFHRVYLTVLSQGVKLNFVDYFHPLGRNFFFANAHYNCLHTSQIECLVHCYLQCNENLSEFHSNCLGRDGNWC